VVRPLIFGVLSFVVVFVLIVGGTTAYLVYRTSQTPAEPTPTAATPTDPSGTPSPTEDETWCWYPSKPQRVSTNPEGKLRGGQLEIETPPGFTDRYNDTQYAFTDDPQIALARAEPTWSSSFFVGAVQWQTGYEYPGAEAASTRIVDCMKSNSGMWGAATQRSEENREEQSVTIDGAQGYEITMDYMFSGKTGLETTEGSRIDVVVVDAPDGPSVYVSEVAIGMDEHTDQAVETRKTLAVVDE
jgi:hypothetical protein